MKPEEEKKLVAERPCNEYDIFELNEEKKIVIKKLMGWRIRALFHPDNKTEIEGWRKTVIHEKDCYLWNWNPQKDRNCWDEIWDKLHLDETLFMDYIGKLCSFENVEPEPNTYIIETIFIIQKAKPSVCWKALVEVLEK